MNFTKKQKLIVILIAATTFLLTVLGIFLSATAGFEGSESVVSQNGDIGRFDLGVFLAAINGVVFLSIVGIYFVTKIKTESLKSDPEEDLRSGAVSEENYKKIKKRTMLVSGAVTAASAVLIILWFNAFSLMLGIMIAAGAAGAYVLVTGGKSEMKTLSLTVGGILAVVFVLFSGDMSDKNYDYVVNGVRMSNASESISSKLAGGAAIVFVTGFIIMGISYLIKILCTIQKNQENEEELR